MRKDSSPSCSLDEIAQLQLCRPHCSVAEAVMVSIFLVFDAVSMIIATIGKCHHRIPASHDKLRANHKTYAHCPSDAHAYVSSLTIPALNINFQMERARLPVFCRCEHL